MKPVNKKSYINISHLIQNYQAEGEQPSRGRSNVVSSRPSSQGSHYDASNGWQKENSKNQMNMTLNRKVSLKLDKKSDFQLQKQLFPAGKKQAAKLHIQQKSEEKSVMKIGGGHQSQLRFKQLQNLIVSERMFIDPDKWQSFIQRSKTDQRFQNALSAFLYSYFIQNYQ